MDQQTGLSDSIVTTFLMPALAVSLEHPAFQHIVVFSAVSPTDRRHLPVSDQMAFAKSNSGFLLFYLGRYLVLPPQGWWFIISCFCLLPGSFKTICHSVSP